MHFHVNRFHCSTLERIYICMKAARGGINTIAVAPTSRRHPTESKVVFGMIFNKFPKDHAACACTAVGLEAAARQYNLPVCTFCPVAAPSSVFGRHACLQSTCGGRARDAMYAHVFTIQTTASIDVCAFICCARMHICGICGTANRTYACI